MSTELKAQPREKLGTRASNKLRGAGRIPATLQTEGPESQHVDLSIDEEEFLTMRRHHVHVFDLALAGKTESALVNELQWDVFGERILHVEFRRVDRHKKTEVEVPIEFFGHTATGILNTLLSEVTLISIPDKIPNTVRVRLEGLNEGDHIVASAIELPEGVELGIEPDTMIATVSGASSVEPEEAPEEEEGEAAEGEAPEGEEKTPEEPEKED